MFIEAGIATADRSSQILDVAERLAQTRGFNAFSYADIAAEIDVSKAALHYHYRSKAVLGDVLIARYADRFFAALAGIRDSVGAPEKLEAYVDLYRGVLRSDRLCLCGILAAEYQTLPPSMREAVLDFFDRNEAWLEDVLLDGIAAGTIRPQASVRDTAQLLISGLEGSMMLARARGDVNQFDRSAERMLANLVPEVRGRN